MCPELELVEQDPATVEQAWEEILRRLEDAGFAVEPAEPGLVYFDSKGVERLYGGLEPALKRALAAVGTVWDARRGGRAAVRGARGGERGTAGAGADRLRRPRAPFLAPLPLQLLPLDRRRYEELEELGVKTIGQLAGLPGGAVAERLGPEAGAPGAWREGEEHGRVVPRRPATPSSRRSSSRKQSARADAPARARGAARQAALPAGTRGAAAAEGRALGAARRRRLVAPDGDTPRADRRSGTAPRGARAEARRAAGAGAQAAARGGRSSPSTPASSSSSSPPRASVLQGRLREGLRQVKAAVGAGGVSTVVEVAPWSRIPEARALLVPRDD